jgi:hypothetical protein
MREGVFGVAAFQAKMDRLDAIINRRVGEEEAALKCEDARQRRSRRLIAQTNDDAYRALQVTTPKAADDESPSRYRARLFNGLARRLPPVHDPRAWPLARFA